MNKVYKPGIYKINYRFFDYIYVESQNNDGQYVWTFISTPDPDEDDLDDLNTFEQELFSKLMIYAKRVYSNELRKKLNLEITEKLS